IGAGIERLVVAHHRRRLRRSGWARAYDPPADGLWCAGDPPPREGNRFDVHVDGEEALGALERDLAAAEESVTLAGWHFDPAFRLTRSGPTLRQLLAEVAERADVRLLAWAGAPLPIFNPSRAAVRTAREALVKGTRIRMELDAKERPMHCHHEKLAVIDGRIAWVGGIDLTALSGDRLDTRRHAPRGSVGWRDAAARLQGPLVADGAAHIALRWREVRGEPLEPARLDVTQSRRGGVQGQFVRTIPNGIYDAVPHGDYRILEAYLRAARSARRLVYRESPFLGSGELVPVLSAQLADPPTDEVWL